MRSLALALASVLCSTVCLSTQPVTVRPDVMVHGKSQSDWSREWWQWASAFEPDSSPIEDDTGSNCHLKQSGRVWFLAGTYGSRRVVRTCHVPKGKFLFFPLINYAAMPTPDSRLICEAAMMQARLITDDPAVLVLEVDGRRITGLERHRQATPDCFDMAAYTQSKARVFPSAANGYYAMLRPLPPGKHTLNFGGILPGLSQAVTYTLIVE